MPSPMNLIGTPQMRIKPPKKELEGIMLKKGEDGGHIAEHHFTSYEHKMEPHVFGASEGRDFVNHVIEHMGVKMGDETESEGVKEEQAGAKE